MYVFQIQQEHSFDLHFLCQILKLLKDSAFFRLEGTNFQVLGQR